MPPAPPLCCYSALSSGALLHSVCICICVCVAPRPSATGPASLRYPVASCLAQSSIRIPPFPAAGSASKATIARLTDGQGRSLGRASERGAALL
ncbi:hypothetical protein CALCODRAFT_501957 [Calocera cornea HHB12733]|uniref:Secreted protein n=1 Tax=Calocera cornea HHB12733 TaxID=1353952 RepID=A0A165DFD9_9BASI|nr:hypothetical protein CALCODRAFT_501957 [Calocera cornea HHB12733]